MDVFHMLKPDDFVDLHPENEAEPWISNIVMAPKPDGNIRITLDARNLNKAIMSTNLTNTSTLRC